MLTALRPEKVWWTATEVAEARLPDMPGTQQNVDLGGAAIQNYRASAPARAVAGNTTGNSSRLRRGANF